VLAGTFEPPQSCDPFTKKVLAHLKRPATVRLTKAPELAEYIYRWKRAWEETSSSYSNVHFSHYIAGSQDERIAQFNAGMAAIPAATGYSPNRWRHGLNLWIDVPGIILGFEEESQLW